MPIQLCESDPQHIRNRFRAHGNPTTFRHLYTNTSSHVLVCESEARHFVTTTTVTICLGISGGALDGLMSFTLPLVLAGELRGRMIKGRLLHSQRRKR